MIAEHSRWRLQKPGFNVVSCKSESHFHDISAGLTVLRSSLAERMFHCVMEIMFILVSQRRKCFLSPSNYLPLCEVNAGSRLHPFHHTLVLFTSNKFYLKKKLSKLFCTLLLSGGVKVFCLSWISQLHSGTNQAVWPWTAWKEVTTDVGWSVTGLTSISCCLSLWLEMTQIHTCPGTRT